MRVGFGVLVLDSFLSISCTGLEDCKNKSTSECCENYYPEDTRCKPCIGSFGRNCSGGPCTPGYYGHGCNERCDCGTIVCDRTSGCPQDLKTGTYHYWTFIVLGTLVINSIPITIAINAFISTRTRITRGEQDNNQETARRKRKLNIFSGALLKRFRRAPSSDDDEEDAENPNESSLESPKRRGKLNVYVDALLNRVRKAPPHNDVDSNKPTEDYFAMRMSMAPPKDKVHHFTGDEGEDEDDIEEEEYVEMNVQSDE